MKKTFLTVLLVILLATLALCGLTTALAASTASLAQGAASTLQSVLALSMQCLSGVMIALALIAGIAIGSQALSRRPAAPPQGQLPWLRARRRLPSPQQAILLDDYQPEAVDDQVFGDWEW
jgi:hypothetical protein